ncbi:unnamed protein product [Rotaria sp. Silwood1]|nr:unnamed protein product [Rotaria sp. Silwood1]CAF0855812.1 unnamed protein product [Rotaria sp. Silwood1]
MNNLKAIKFLTTVDPSFIDQNLQLYSNIYENMQLGDYGPIESSILEKYHNQCNHFWQKANIFQINPTPNFEQSQSQSLALPLSYSSISTMPPPSYLSCDNNICSSSSKIINVEFLYTTTIGITITTMKYKRNQLFDLHELAAIFDCLWKSIYMSIHFEKNNLCY